MEIGCLVNKEKGNKYKPRIIGCLDASIKLLELYPCGGHLKYSTQNSTDEDLIKIAKSLIKTDPTDEHYRPCLFSHAIELLTNVPIGEADATIIGKIAWEYYSAKNKDTYLKNVGQRYEELASSKK